jgi:TPR repeat protein
MIRLLLCSAMVAGLALAAADAAQADVKTGVDAWSRGDYAAAVREWKAPAAKGDSDAQFNLGQAYKLGRGVPRDLAKAEALFAEAAATGHIQAADNYGLLLFQRGERARALPYLTAAAQRGDARAQYLLGIAHFNGDTVPKDWVRAYALMSLAQQAGLPQAVSGLAQMDQYIPLEQRQESIKLAARLAAEAEATRERQLAAMDLGAAAPSAGSPSPASMSKPSFPTGSRVPTIAARADAPQAKPATPRPAAPKVPPVAEVLDRASPPPASPEPAARPAPAKPLPTKPALAKPAQATGEWRVQLGAFGIPANAEALWKRVSTRAELAGHGKLLVPAGRLRKLQAGGFASRTEAQDACRRLTAAGFTCIAVKD